MRELLSRYCQWLHLQWPAGSVEKLPEVRPDGSTNVPGLYVAGDLTGVPLLKIAADSGARAVRTIVADGSLHRSRGADDDVLDLVIVGGGVSGMAAALEARKEGLRFVVLEAAEPFSTIVNFPKGKPIYTYPAEMTPAGELHIEAQVKEPLVAELRAQTLEAGIETRAALAEKVVRRGSALEVVIRDADSLLARSVIVGIGRSGNFRRLGVPGEDLDHKVFNRLHDPKDFAGQDVLVVGGGDSALECAIALGQCGARVAISYRKSEFSRPKPDNVEKLKALRADPMAPVAVPEPTSERVTTSSGVWLDQDRVPGAIELHMGSTVKEIREDEVVLVDGEGSERTLANDVVFTMIGREPPLDFFRRSGVRIRGESTPTAWIGITLFFLLAAAFYSWKSGGPLSEHLRLDGLPHAVASWGEGWKAAVEDRTTVAGTLAVSMSTPSFWFTLLYTAAILIFGIRRIRRRRTPYVAVQTTALFLIQLLPLWLLPEVALPWMGYNGAFESGLGATVANELFPLYTASDAAWPPGGHPRAYWHAYGLILAWPLNIYNVMTPTPMIGWLIISAIQTFVLIPLLVWRFGKGAYCGWICSCGGLAETLGDDLRHKMPHGPTWNRLNLVGQVVLLAAAILALVRIAGWVFPGSIADRVVESLVRGPLGYKWMVDVLLAGVLGTGLYFKLSGRVWCRFACPLAALMHIYARVSRFRIFAEKKKCISCNVCTSVCHQGIDVMSFANKGRPMADPECVRCSACVQSCPTDVLAFGRVDAGGREAARDALPASHQQMQEAGPSRSRLFFNRQMGRVAVGVLVAAGALAAIGWGAGDGGDTRAGRSAVAATSRPTSRPSSQPAPPAAPTPSARAEIELTTEPDHGPLDGILKATVRDERVDYPAVRREHAGPLRRYLDAMSRVDRRAMPRRRRFAYYANVYNATVIATVAERYHPGYGVADDDYTLFNEPLVRLADASVSLDHLEKKIMWDDFEDPRMHVALVCGAVSCPPILPRAYRAEGLDEILDRKMRTWIADDPARNVIDVPGKRLRLSRIFDWYARDFGGRDRIERYVDRWHPAEIEGFEIEFLPYDWSLNLASP